MSSALKWRSLGILIIILLEWGITRSMVEDEEDGPSFLKIISPPYHLALSGDFTIFITKSDNQNIEDDRLDDYGNFSEGNNTREILNDYFLLRISYITEDISETVGEIPLERSLDESLSRDENISLTIPCGFFTRGGIYMLSLQYKFQGVPGDSPESNFSKLQAKSVLDVKWPTPFIYLEPETFTTYPSNPILATIKYDEIVCKSFENVSSAFYILQLIYCGSTSTTCYPENNTHAQVLHYEEVKGFYSKKVFTFRCEYFGLPGTYAVRLRGSTANPNAPTTSVYMKVHWSEEFAFNVHARSIYPCEGSGGVSVLFQYPACRLQGDRVRVYGRLRADVTSLASPSSLHYITELRSIPGKHSLTFDCELFTEKFVEYCFVYVSQAITGAMADVKISCIPTFPFQESDAAGWGPWSPWSPCSSSCFGGIRNRYRFCDAPPPKYGAKFCQGKAVETEFCSNAPLNNYKLWNAGECSNVILAATRPEVAAEIGSQCRCGCILTLQEQFSRKVLAANTQACPGRSFWLLQTDAKFVIGLHLDQLQFRCPGQYFRARDGDSLSANLLTDVTYERTINPVETLMSTGQNLLLEFFSDELTASGESCIGGFLAHAALVQKEYAKNRNLSVVPFKKESIPGGAKGWSFWRPAHLATASILIIIFLLSIFLTLQFFLKYRKYKIAEDLDNCSDTSELIPGELKSSRSTLISDIPSTIELPRKDVKTSVKNQTVEEVEDQYDSTETLTECKEGSNLSSSTLKLKDNLETDSDNTLTSTKSNTGDNLLSAASVKQPEVKYAYPVKLRTLESEEKSLTSQDLSLQGSSSIAESLNLPRLRYRAAYLDSKDSSPVCILSNSPSLRSGKETKDRRNRERLLQRPGSDFSLANPDSELELDYYDYNVANASAVPGSYLGMDPAFLVWIPPISNTDIDADDLFLDDDHRSKRSSVLTLDTEGAALTPLEYRKYKFSGLEDFGLGSDVFLSGEERSIDHFDINFIPEDIYNSPRGRILGQRVIEEPSQESSQDAKDKRPHTSQEEAKVHDQRQDYKALRNYWTSQDRKIQDQANLDDQKKEQVQKSQDQRNPTDLKVQHDYKALRNYWSTHDRRSQEDQRIPGSPCIIPNRLDKSENGEDKHGIRNNTEHKYKEFIDSTQSYAANKITDSAGIPMTELSTGHHKSFIHGPKIDNKDIESSVLQSPDYGIDTAEKERSSFFHDEDIKFVDEDEDEFIDQRIGI